MTMAFFCSVSHIWQISVVQRFLLGSKCDIVVQDPTVYRLYGIKHIHTHRIFVQIPMLYVFFLWLLVNIPFWVAFVKKNGRGHLLIHILWVFLRSISAKKVQMEFLPLCDLLFNVISLCIYSSQCIFNVVFSYACYESGKIIYFTLTFVIVLSSLILSQVIMHFLSVLILLCPTCGVHSIVGAF